MLPLRLRRTMISDRGPQFVAQFTRELYRLLGIKLAASTAYHPQTDRQFAAGAVGFSSGSGDPHDGDFTRDIGHK
jgi:hypothetical protein